MSTDPPEFPPIQPLVPRERVPELSLDRVGGDRWTLSEAQPERFTLLVFYRGLHCPLCRTYLQQLVKLLDDFAEIGVEAIAISSDDQGRAERTLEEWELAPLPILHSLPLDKAREWGLYISSSRGVTSVGVEEPHRFAEPALYLVRPDGTLYFGMVQTMPFARPDFRSILGSVKWIIENDYPGRGEIR